jgi:VWFA-related protein
MCRDAEKCYGRTVRQRRLIALGAALALAAGRLEGRQQAPRFHERIDVARVVVDARVVDDRGNPVIGLSADDFAVKIDRKACRVETASWIGEHQTAAVPDDALSDGAAPAGRLVVFLFQKDLEPSRIVGLMRMLMRSRDFLGTLAPADRVAILSFDSHLKIWSDFTNDRESLDRLLQHGVLLDRPPLVPRQNDPSLVERLDPRQANHAYGMERALLLIGRALEPLPGSKSVVLVGHGFGHYTPDGVFMEADYEPARRALVAARTSVFSLDVTDADYHSLEAGLQMVSEETGGFYARTHIFPGQAMQRLSGALAGSYVLFVEAPDDSRAEHAIEVTLLHRKGHVLATTSYASQQPRE